MSIKTQEYTKYVTLGEDFSGMVDMARVLQFGHQNYVKNVKL